MSETKKFEISPSVAIIVAGVIIAAAIVYTNLHPAAPAADVQQPAVEPHVPAPTAADHTMGSANAPIVLVEYSDFQCPFCSLVYPTIKRIVDESNGQIAWVMRNLPLTSIHPNANPAANAGECIAAQLGNDAWWKFSDDIFANQDKMSDAFYLSLATKYGADLQKYNACVKAHTYQSKIDTQSNDAMNNGGQGTPFTVVYTTKSQVSIPGALPYEQFMSVINAAKARQ